MLDDCERTPPCAGGPAEAGGLLPKQMTILNASSCTHLFMPWFSLSVYPFVPVVARTLWAEYICSFLLEQPGSSKPGLPKL